MFGADPTDPAAQSFLDPGEPADTPDDVCEVWPENWAAVEAFLAVETQWRISPAGGLLGLDYAGVRAALDLLEVPGQRALFVDLQVMERAAIEAK